MRNRRNLKRKSDFICRKVLEGIRFSPICAQTDCRVEGRLTLGIGGSAYGYWRSPKTMKLHTDLEVFREISGKDISFQEVQDLVGRYIGEFVNPIVAGRFDIQLGDGSLLDALDAEAIEALFRCFFEHISRFVEDTSFWLPLTTVHLEGFEFSGCHFSIYSKPQPAGIDDREVEGMLGRLPILENAASYMRITARNAERALEKANVVLGALMLCMHEGNQYVHTMGKPASGILNFDGRLNFQSSVPHVPYLATQITLNAADQGWLSGIDAVWEHEPANKKLIRALQCLRASWFLKGAERFSCICQALDAATPSKFNTMMAKCSWASQALPEIVDDEAVQLLFKKLRSDVMHGDAPSLVDSKAYVDFIAKYATDPLLSAFEITRQVLFQTFLPDMIVRPHPLAELPESLAALNAPLRHYGMEYVPSDGFDFSRLSSISIAE